MAGENLKEFKEEICRHFDVVAESLEDKIKQVAEGVRLSSQKLDVLIEFIKIHKTRT